MPDLHTIYPIHSTDPAWPARRCRAGASPRSRPPRCHSSRRSARRARQSAPSSSAQTHQAVQLILFGQLKSASWLRRSMWWLGGGRGRTAGRPAVLLPSSVLNRHSTQQTDEELPGCGQRSQHDGFLCFTLFTRSARRASPSTSRSAQPPRIRLGKEGGWRTVVDAGCVHRARRLHQPPPAAAVARPLALRAHPGFLRRVPGAI